MRALKMKSVLASHGKLRTTNWEPSLKLLLLQLHEKLLKNSTLTILRKVIWHLKQIRKVKKLGKWVSHELTADQKNHRFEVLSSLIPHNNGEPFLKRIVTRDEKWILYDNQQRPAQWLDWEAPKHFQKHTHTWKKVTVTVWWSAARLIHYSFPNPSETITPLPPRSMLSKSMRCTKNCIACSWHWSTERTHFFSMTMSNCTWHNQCFKSWKGWAVKLCHVHLTSCQRITTSSSILTTFCRENAATTSRRRKMLSKSSSNAEAQIFMLKE